ncbi:MAG: M12 family metallo-peptidase [Verrucomicrobiales bacterium]
MFWPLRRTYAVILGLLLLAMFFVAGEFPGGLAPTQQAKIPASQPSIVPESATLVSKSTHARSGEFSPAMQEIVEAADHGRPFRLRVPGMIEQNILVRPLDLFAAGFQWTIGADAGIGGADAETGIRAYDGRSFSQPDVFASPSLVSLAVVGSHMQLEVLAADGSRLVVSGDDPQSMDVRLVAGSSSAGAECTIDDRTGTATFRQREIGVFEKVTPGEPLALNLVRGEFGPAVLGLAGANPATGKVDRFVEPIPTAAQYAHSLTDILLLLVIDKEATGANTRENLERKASEEIARIANVATIYENQLGLRLLLQELIMIPDDDAFTDVPFRDPLKDFRDWCHEHRRFSSFDWTCAMKEGAGLRGAGTLGIANLARVYHREAVSVVQTDTDYLVLAHEMAHNLGTAHTSGGIMNATASANHRRSFFDDVLGKDGATAAMDIHAYFGNRSKGGVPMRDPRQMPFAHSDTADASAGGAVVPIRVLANDSDHVRHGLVNTAMSVVETSRVLPEGAGSAVVRSDGQGVEFFPAPQFSGTAWFSYTLRGNVGNESQGWLHKGDVAVLVPGDAAGEGQAHQIRLRPGGAYSFFPAGQVSTFTQPQQSQIIRSTGDRNLLIIRAPGNAEGSDMFQVNDVTYEVAYLDDPPVASTDTVWIDRYQPSIWIQPLVNDLGAGQLWLQQIDPRIGTDATSHFFVTSMRLLKATTRNPELGRISLEQLPVTIDGKPVQTNTGRILFQTSEDVQGVSTIDYTIEDASGRQAEGQIIVQVNFGYDDLVLPDGRATITVPDEASIEHLRSWTGVNFDDTGWRTGALGIGYDTDGGYQDWIGTDVRDTLFQAGTSVYVRVPFTVSSTAAYTALGFRARYDDGFVAYLNGRQVISKNAPDIAVWNSAATIADEHARIEPFYAVDLSAHRDLLVPGRNVLALHVMNDTASSSDLLMQPALVGYPMAPEAPAISPFQEKFLQWRGTYDVTDGLPGGDWREWDTDNDTFPDRVEFVAAGSPVDSGSRPALALDVVQSGPRRTVLLRYLRRKDAADLGIGYRIEHASQLASDGTGAWEVIDPDVLINSGGSVTTSSTGEGIEAVDVRIPLDSRDVSETFYRMRYVLPE